MDEDTPNAYSEKTMSTHSIQELEACLETTLRSIEGTDVEIGKHEAGSHEAAALACIMHERVSDELLRGKGGSLAG